MQYAIPHSNLSALFEKLEALNRRAVKLSAPQIAYADLGEDEDAKLFEVESDSIFEWCTKEQLKDVKGELTGAVMPVHIVEVEGEAPSFDGWKFVATLEPFEPEDGPVENLVATAPGETCPPEFRTRVGECDHCKASRRRKETFVLKSADGEYVCLGRACIKDFLKGHASPDKLASWAELIFSMTTAIETLSDFDRVKTSRASQRFDLTAVLAITSAVMRERGWKSRRAARESESYDATADIVGHQLYRQRGTEIDSAYKPTDADRDNAAAAIEWALENTDESDYIRNLNLIARCDYVTDSSLGLACSMLVSFNHDLAKRKTKAQSEHQGTIGVRSEFVLSCLRVTGFDTQFGPAYVYQLTDALGNSFAWFTSNGPRKTEIDVGVQFVAKATVKEHTEFKGVKQTTLTRLTVQTIVE